MCVDGMPRVLCTLLLQQDRRGVVGSMQLAKMLCLFLCQLSTITTASSCQANNLLCAIMDRGVQQPVHCCSAGVVFRKRKKGCRHSGQANTGPEDNAHRVAPSGFLMRYSSSASWSPLAAANTSSSSRRPYPSSSAVVVFQLSTVAYSVKNDLQQQLRL